MIRKLYLSLRTIKLVASKIAALVVCVLLLFYPFIMPFDRKENKLIENQQLISYRVCLSRRLFKIRLK